MSKQSNSRSFIIALIALLLSIQTIISCIGNDRDTVYQNEAHPSIDYKKCDFVINNIDTVYKVDYKNNTVPSKLSGFSFGNQYRYNISFDDYMFADNLSYITIDNALDSNSFIAMIIDKEYGIDKYVFVDYSIKDDSAVIKVSNSEIEICVINLDLNEGNITIFNTNAGKGQTKSFDLCDGMMTAASAPWVIGFAAAAMPGASIAAGVVYWLLGHFMCDTVEPCPNCGAEHKYLEVLENPPVVRCKNCGWMGHYY